MSDIINISFHSENIISVYVYEYACTLSQISNQQSALMCTLFSIHHRRHIHFGILLNHLFFLLHISISS